ncbi:MAG: MarR family transcriptional regulator [Cyanobacteria bacterium P01_C01_bin.72]
MSRPENIKPPPEDQHGLIQACRNLHAVVDEFDAAIADKVGISRNDLRCLNLLEHGPMLPKNIGSKLELTSGSITALLDRLEKRKLIKRKPHPEDRRAILIEATPLVYQELGQMYRKMGEAVVELSNEYGRKEATQTAKHLNDLSNKFKNVINGLKG